MKDHIRSSTKFHAIILLISVGLLSIGALGFVPRVPWSPVPFLFFGFTSLAVNALLFFGPMEPRGAASFRQAMTRAEGSNDFEEFRRALEEIHTLIRFYGLCLPNQYRNRLQTLGYREIAV